MRKIIWALASAVLLLLSALPLVAAARPVGPEAGAMALHYKEDASSNPITLCARSAPQLVEDNKASLIPLATNYQIWGNPESADEVSIAYNSRDTSGKITGANSDSLIVECSIYVHFAKEVRYVDILASYTLVYGPAAQPVASSILMSALTSEYAIAHPIDVAVNGAAWTSERQLARNKDLANLAEANRNVRLANARVDRTNARVQQIQAQNEAQAQQDKINHDVQINRLVRILDPRAQNACDQLRALCHALNNGLFVASFYERSSRTVAEKLFSQGAEISAAWRSRYWKAYNEDMLNCALRGAQYQECVGEVSAATSVAFINSGNFDK